MTSQKALKIIREHVEWTCYYVLLMTHQNNHSDPVELQVERAEDERQIGDEAIVDLAVGRGLHEVTDPSGVDIGYCVVIATLAKECHILHVIFAHKTRRIMPYLIFGVRRSL